MVVAAYVRVSSRGQNVATQREAITQAAKARGHRIARWYVEHASAGKISRPELNRLREDARAGALERVYVFKLDRLSRTGIRDTLAVLQELRAHGCEVESLADGFSLSGPHAEPMIAMMAWCAQQERAAIGERIAAARARVEAAGGTWGRPRRVSVDRVRMVREQKAKGKTIRQIAMSLKIPKSTVGDILSEKGAYGGVRSGGQKPGLKKAGRGASR